MRKLLVSLSVAVGLFVTIVLFRLPKALAPASPIPTTTPTPDSGLKLPAWGLYDEEENNLRSYYEGE